jgi:2-amino-4-hydroxy-6-hydroxymethyldihydropteridine diphosphokinase
MLHRSYVGLGSNLSSAAGTAMETLQAAIPRLQGLGRVGKKSRYYRTRPVAYVEQPSFINAVVEIETSLEPLELLTALLRIEREFGRDRSRGPAKGPRTLDLDLLLVDDLQISTADLTLPHPELAFRRFVLAPLAEIAPDLQHPILKRTIAELLASLPTEGDNGVEAVQVVEETP